MAPPSAVATIVSARARPNGYVAEQGEAGQRQDHRAEDGPEEPRETQEQWNRGRLEALGDSHPNHGSKRARDGPRRRARRNEPERDERHTGGDHPAGGGNGITLGGGNGSHGSLLGE